MISQEYVSLLSSLLVTGYQSEYYYYGYSGKGSFTFQFPTGIVMVAKSGGVIQSVAPAKVVSIVEQGGELSVTFSATFTTTFSANEIDIYAVIGTTLLYKIAYATGYFESSADDNLSICWTIDIVVNNVFNVGSSNFQTVQLPNNYCIAISGQVVIYPYLVHFIIALTLIPSPAYTVQSSYPNIPLATMLANIPIPSSPQQLKGVTAFAYLCNSEEVTLCYPVYNKLGTAVITQQVNCNATSVVMLYQVGSVYLAYMSLPVQVSLNIGNTYTYEVGVNVT